MSTLLRKDDGAVAVTVAILGTVFIILSALVVDMGYWYNVRRQLQTCADSAALAGCRELAVGATNQEIWQTVTAYANKNAVVPVDAVAVVAPSPAGESDIGDDFVKVTVSSDAAGFFARALGFETNTIRAQSKARLGYLKGVRTPVPWGLPILSISRMIAITDNSSTSMSSSGGNYWNGWLPSTASGPVSVVTYNSQTLDPAYPDGVPETFGPAATIVHLSGTTRFADVRMPQQVFTSGWGETVRVNIDLVEPLSPDEAVVVVFGRSEYVATPESGTAYTASFSAPDISDLWQDYPVGVAIMNDNKVVEQLPAALSIAVRRSTHPIKSIQVEPIVQPAGSSQPIQVSVEINDFEIGKLYELKVVGGGAETGNFMALDFHTLRHTPYWRHPQDPEEYPDMPNATGLYYDFIEGTADYDFMAHIGDTVWTQPGSMSGPQTANALDVRIGSEPSDYPGWVAADKPASSRVIYLPITEKVQETTGQTPLRIVSFASFYIESVSSNALIKGRFVDYVSPAWMVTPTPPNSRFVVVAPHLVADGVDF
ncbi:MAG: hypothetical protein CVT60_01895 [Actinobacteria bacterium HGW-Actinobacteria-10]|jgi:hypothetical protein|nr:MAG: hypothetical protein CVT60_01895 [Actinobacteria bacterium HGW-Actinobacteria-10]